ncbi:MAG: alpha/beta fold hydrolase [Vicinamibacterales bacterium]
MGLRLMNRVRIVRALLALTFVAVAAAAPAQTAGSLTTSDGKHPDGTAWRIDVPGNWNRILLVGLDYAASPPNAASQGLLARGYAMAGTTRLVTGWDVSASIANQLATIDRFTEKHGQPERVFVLGSSLGAHTGAATIQAHPERFQGAVLMCGGLAGAVGLWDSKLDALFVAKTLLAPNDPSTPMIRIPADFAETARPAWLKMLAAAQETPAGRARIALAAVIAQLPTWSNARKPQPAASDRAALQVGLYDSLAGGPLPVVGQAMSSRNEIERRSGGNISSNVGVDYAALLQRSGNADLVAALYREAGLELQADLATLAGAPRISHDASARAWAAPGVWNGALTFPVLTLNGIGDQISPVAGQEAYQQVVTRAGKGELLRQLYTNTAGHCGFSAAETVTAVEALRERVATGRWGDLDAERLNATAQVLNLGAARFQRFAPPTFLRPHFAAATR